MSVKSPDVASLPVSPARTRFAVGTSTTAASTCLRSRYFKTDHIVGDLKRRSIRDGAVTLVAQGLKHVMQLGSTVALARILTPSDFGLVAIVTAVTGFVAMFKDAGLSTATIQRNEITHSQVSALFWINVAISCFLMLLCAAAAPVVAWIYAEPRLLGIMLVLSGTLMLGGLTVQHQALLRRQMQFAKLAAIDVGSMAVGAAVGVSMAFAGFGYWALVGLSATQVGVNTALVWFVHGWVPGLPTRDSEVRPMLKFGAFLSGSSLLAYIRRNGDNLLLGAVCGADGLGLYSRAYQLLTLPIQQINGPVSAIAVPLLSRLRDKPELYRQAYCRILEFSSALAFPLTIFCIVAAENIVVVVLGSQWLEVVTIFRVLAPAGLVGALNIAGSLVFVTSGRTDKQFRANVYTTLTSLFAFLIALPWGVLGMATAVSVSFCVSFPLTFAYAFRGTPLSMRHLCTAIWRPFVASAFAAVATAALSRFLPKGHALNLLLTQVASYCAVYSCTFIVLSGGIRQLRSKINSIFNRKAVDSQPAA